MSQAPELTKKLADEIARVSKEARDTSQRAKLARMKAIKESEDYYLGIVKPQLRNVFNVPFPFMSGFVDYLMGKIDRPPRILYTHNKLAQYTAARKIQAAWEMQATANVPNAKWDMKDRWLKRNAIFAGRAQASIFSESEPEYKNYFNVVDHYDFHCEPAGGGYLENHLYCGEDGIYKNEEDVVEKSREGYYDREQVAELLNKTNKSEHKETQDEYDTRNARLRAMGIDVETENFVGQTIYRFSQFIVTYRGVRWYVLFEPQNGLWVRIKPWKEVVKSGLYPYISWATHEDPRNYWSKAPADDARPLAEVINILLNQELYNRHKKNMGQRAYDPTMFHDVEALSDWRPDGLVPVDTKGGTRSIESGMYNFQVGDLGGTINLVQFLDAYFGKQSGSSPKPGESPASAKVGIYFGDLKQIEDRLGTYNKSYRDFYADAGLRFAEGLDEHLTTPMAIKMIGPTGEEIDSELTRADLSALHGAPSIRIEGGTEEESADAIKSERKMKALGLIQTANPRWKDEQLMRAAGWDEADIKKAFEPNLSAQNMDTLAEAAQACEDILKGKKVKLNKGATADFMQYIIDFATDADDISDQKFDQLMEYAKAHGTIAAANEARNVIELRKKLAEGTAVPGAPAVPGSTPPAAPAREPLTDTGIESASIPPAVREVSQIGSRI